MRSKTVVHSSSTVGPKDRGLCPRVIHRSIHSLLVHMFGPWFGAGAGLGRTVGQRRFDLVKRSGGFARPICGNGNSVPAGGAAEASRSVAGQVEYESFAFRVGADSEPCKLVGADDVDHRHRSFDGDAGGQRLFVVDGMKVPVQVAVANESGERGVLGKHGVHDVCSLVSVAGEQRAQHRPECVNSVELGLGAVVSAGVSLLVEEHGQLARRRERTRFFVGVHDRDSRDQRTFYVMSKNHFDTLPRGP